MIIARTRCPPSRRFSPLYDGLTRPIAAYVVTAAGVTPTRTPRSTRSGADSPPADRDSPGAHTLSPTADSPLDRLSRPVIDAQDRGPIPRPLVVNEVGRHGPTLRSLATQEPYGRPLKLSRQQLLYHAVDASHLGVCRPRTTLRDV